jgi:hypothetical protein
MKLVSNRLGSALIAALVAAAISVPAIAFGGGASGGVVQAAKKQKGLTKAAVNSMIGSYIAAHRTQLQGSAGTPGTPGVQGTPGTPGQNGQNGQNGAPGSARAYALVDRFGALTFNKNIASATPVHPGEYCITPRAAAGIDITTTQPVVTVDYTGTNDPDVIAEIRSSSFDCPGAFEVMMWRQSVVSGALVSTLTPEEFFVLIP